MPLAPGPGPAARLPWSPPADVGRLPGVTDLSELAETGVDGLLLDATAAPVGLGGLERLNGLHSLVLGAEVELTSLDRLPSAASLTDLSLPNRFPDLTDLGTWPTLTTLGLHYGDRPLHGAEWRAVAALPALDSLVLGPEAMRGTAEHGVALPGITRLILFGEPVELAPLVDAFPGLRSLVLARLAQDLSPLARLPELTSVTLNQPAPNHGLPDRIEVSAPPAPRY